MQPVVYTKGGIEKPVYTPAQAVNLRADGWTELVVEQTEDASIEASTEASTESQPDPDMGAGADQGADTAPE